MTVGSPDPSAPLPAAALRAAAAQLPTRGIAPLTIAYRPCDVGASGVGAPGTPQYEACPAVTLGSVTGVGSSQISVGGDELLRAALGRTDAGAERPLAAGEVVVLDPNIGGERDVLVFGAATGSDSVPLPAVHPSLGLSRLPSELPSAVISTAAARRLGLAVHVQDYLIDTTRVPAVRRERELGARLLGPGQRSSRSSVRGSASWPGCCLRWPSSMPAPTGRSCCRGRRSGSGCR